MSLLVLFETINRENAGVFFSRLTTYQSLFILISTSLLIKLAMGWYLPVTGDEAYFILWGNHPDYGYYDHPPMVGWWLTGLLQFGEHPLWLRLPSILTTTLIGWMIYRLVLPRGKTNAVIAAGLYWLTPVHLLAPLITTDVPLILFAFLSGVGFYKAQRHDRYGWYLLSGIFLGLAFYSKFFAGMLGVAYFIYVVLFVRRGWRPYIGILLVLVGTLPFISLNLVWNYHHCWDNYLFNLQNRTSDFEFSLWSLTKYLLLLAYLMTPPIVFYVFRRPRELLHNIKDGGLGVFLALFFIPIGLFVLLATGKSIGLHWLLSFYPFLFIGIVLLLHFGQLRVSFYFMWGFALLHVLAFVVISFMLPGLFKDDEKLYKELVYGMYTDELLQLVDSQRYNIPLATPSYSQSALLSYHSGEHVMVLGPGSYHGRQDDILTDFKQYNRKAIAVLSFKSDVANYARFFESFTHVILPFKGTQFHLGIGVGFKFDIYDSEVLSVVRENYYRLPDWLPRDGCYMYDR